MEKSDKYCRKTTELNLVAMTEFNMTHDQVYEMATVELGSPLARIRARGRFRDKDALDFIPTPESLHLYIDTPCYDGPLDLLLHLIRKHSMDIFDIPIVTITKKYLEVLDEMESLNLDVAGEFLLMAATLAEIKSKMLLPKEERKIDDADEEEGVDPRRELIKRLLEYQSFKEASFDLMNRLMIGRDVFLRPCDDANTKKPESEHIDLAEVELAPVELFDLVDELAKVLKKSEQISIHTITRDRISVSARMHELLEFCQIRSKFTFYDALRFFPIYERIDVIVTFLAILEMSRLNLVKLANIPQEDLVMTINKANFYTKQKDVMNNIDVAKSQVEYD